LKNKVFLITNSFLNEGGYLYIDGRRIEASKVISEGNH